VENAVDESKNKPEDLINNVSGYLQHPKPALFKLSRLSLARKGDRISEA
jgi:hypothetical protein